MPPKPPPDYPFHPYSAVEAPYRVNHAVPPRASASAAHAHQPLGRPSSNAPFPPYRFRIAAHYSEDLRHSAHSPTSNDSSSNAPSSNAASSSTSRTSTSASASAAETASSSLASGDPLALHVQPSDTTPSHFEMLLSWHQARLPEPGPAHFYARRALWLTPPSEPPTPASPSPSRIKLEALLNQPGAVESDEVWKAGLKNVWKGLIGGNQLRKRLPLDIVLKILQAGWLRDGTWPEGTVAPTWDDPAPPEPPNGTNPSPAGSSQLQHMQMLMMHSHIPPGYSPSSGDQPEQTYFSQAYAYAQPTPPPVAEYGVGARAGEGHAGDGDADDDEGEAKGEQSDVDAVVWDGDGRHDGG